MISFTTEGELLPVGEWTQQGQEAIEIGWGCPLHGPIQNISSGVGNQVLGWVNYFLPISEMAAMLVAWTIAIGLYYAGSVVLRWLKVVS